MGTLWNPYSGWKEAQCPMIMGEAGSRSWAMQQKVDEPGFRTSGGCLRAGEFEEPSELWRDCEIG